jgi:GMP synthase (glutamine-hydrolysing)
MTRTALAIRHVPFEDLGILDPLLTERGYQVRYLDAGIDPVEDGTVLEADLLVVLGGPIGVNDTLRYPFLVDELRVIGERVNRERLTLGVCLGSQLIAAALGAEVTPARRFEIGFAPVALTPAGHDSVLS